MRKYFLFYLVNFLLTPYLNAQQQISNFNYESPYIEEPSGFIEYNNQIIFEASPVETGRELWSTEKNSSTSTILKDVNEGKIDGLANYRLDFSSTTLNGNLFFIGADENSAGEIWKSDGTTGGTVKITNNLNGGFQKLTTVGNFIYFLRKPSEYILEVWKSDGTTSGTVMVKGDIPVWNRPTFQGKINNTFIFTNQIFSSNKVKVWRSDGTAEGTFPLTDAIDGNGSGVNPYDDQVGTAALSQYLEMDNKLYFVSRKLLHVTDGTLENTKSISNLFQANTNLARFSDVISVNGKLYLMFVTRQNELMIWESDGTALNTKQISYKASSNYDYFVPSKFLLLNNKLYFLGPDQTGTTSLISLNLTTYETQVATQVAGTLVEPLIFNKKAHAANIYTLNSDQYFFSIPTDPLNYQFRKGWFYKPSTNVLSAVPLLDNILAAIITPQNLYYSKNFQVWKFDAQLNSSENILQSPKPLVYPNPTSNYFYLKANKKAENLIITNMAGEVLMKIPSNTPEKIDITRLNPGVYLLTFFIDGKLMTEKIIKK